MNGRSAAPFKAVRKEKWSRRLPKVDLARRRLAPIRLSYRVGGIRRSRRILHAGHVPPGITLQTFTGGSITSEPNKSQVRHAKRWPPAWTPMGLFATAALFRSAQNAGQTTFPLLAKNQLGVGAGTIGTLGTATGAIMVLAAWVLATKFASRTAVAVVAVGAALLAIGLLFAGSATSITQLTAGLVIFGVAGGITPPSLATAIGAASPSQREKQLARYATVLSASLAGGPLLEAGILYLFHQDVRVAFVFFAPFPLLAVALGLRGAWRRGMQGRQLSHEPQPAPAPEVEGVNEHISTAAPDPREVVVTSDPDARRPGRAVLLGTPGGRIALIMQLLYSVPFAAVTVFGALLAHTEFGLSAAHSQLGFTTFFVTSLVSRVVVARRSPIRAKFAVFAVCIILTIAGLALIVLGGPPAVFFLAMALLGIPHGVIFPLALSLVASSAHDAHLAAANAGLFATVGLVSAITPVLLGAIVAASGYQLMTAAVLAPVVLFAALFLTQWSRIPRYQG